MATMTRCSDAAFLRSLSAELFRLEIFDPRYPNRLQMHGDLLADIAQRIGLASRGDEAPRGP